MNSWKKGRTKIQVLCENCHQEFEKTLSEYNRSIKLERKHYCSLNCFKEQKKIKSKFCLYCNKEFIPNERISKFCSNSCSAKYSNHLRKGIKYNLTKEGLVALRKSAKKNLNVYDDEIKKLYNKNPNHCIQCKIILSFWHRKRKFCSIECRRNYDKKNMSKYQKYYRECQFNFNLSDYPNEFDFSLIEAHGWYKAKNKGNNLNGVSRDHMVSIKYGYENNISPEIIKHPANCQLMVHNDNVKKYKNNSITVEELINRINDWNNKYNL